MALVVQLTAILLLLSLASHVNGASTAAPSVAVDVTSALSSTESLITASSAGVITVASSPAGDVSATTVSFAVDAGAAAPSLDFGTTDTSSQTTESSLPNNSSLTDASPSNASFIGDVTTPQPPPAEQTVPVVPPSATGVDPGNASLTSSSDNLTSSFPDVNVVISSPAQPSGGNALPDLVAETTASSTDATTAGTPCDLISANRCLQAGFNDLSQSLFFLFTFRKPQVTVPYFCGKFSAHRTCLQEHLRSCTSKERLRHDVLMAAMDFICLPQATQVVAAVLPCLQNAQTGGGLLQCSGGAQLALRQGDMCSLMSAYTDCASQVFARCSASAASGIRDLLYNTFSPFRATSGCPARPATQLPLATTPSPVPLTGNFILTTTTATVPLAKTGQPSPPQPFTPPPQPLVPPKPRLQLKCYECSSASSGAAFNEYCAPDGDVSRRYLHSSLPCNGPCYSRLQKNYFGHMYVERGCGAGLQAIFPGGIPTHGCHQRPRQTWCFCSHRNGCNIQDMEQYMESV
ncbi:uncharacterized protein LOC112576168 [Pomacea canaliculata]|uniref:uncharacterized protein LOC112576168 n=1 Tax=Pomacea canaliculata TaxID=400727 RepID=UPI000D737106|nr:uncharacterized protein LOC112576168 [Pomacea canaliculata]